MYTFSSYRIGNRASEANNHAASSESSVLRSLFELRKTNNDDDETTHLSFWNCSWSPRILQSLRKILVRDGRTFASIKFFDCSIHSDTTTNESFAEILGMILANNSTTSLVIRGGRLIGEGNGNQEQILSACGAFSVTFPSSCSIATIATALTEGLSNNTSLKSLHLCNSCLDDQSIAQILRSITEHPNLTALNLSRNYLGARTSNAASSSSSSTTALDAVAELLRSESSKLESLDLSHQYQLHPTARPPANESEQEADQQQIEQHRNAFGNALGALSTNNTLRKIDLSRNHGCLSELSGVKAVASCLLSNTSLEHANFSDCGMTHESIVYMGSECLPFCGTSLKALVLCGENDSGIASLNAMEKGLMSNVTIENLGDLPRNGENDATIDRIEHTLNLNKGGRRVVAQRTSERSDLPRAAWSQLLARAGNLDYNHGAQSASASSVVFSLLRQGTILMEH
jgi:hypothetical protein